MSKVRITDYLTPNILPFPNPIDGMIAVNQIAEYFWDKLEELLKRESGGGEGE